jgi:alkylated DNA repair protein alkB homolog 7
VRYCGTTIAGVSLLSDSIMKLVQTADDQPTSDDYRNQPALNEKNNELYSVKILLPRLSLYIMSHTARYNFTHEILKNEESFFKNQTVLKTRRISIICRNEV